MQKMKFITLVNKQK